MNIGRQPARDAGYGSNLDLTGSAQSLKAAEVPQQHPPTFWSDVRAKAKREGVSLRALILGLLKGWLR